MTTKKGTKTWQAGPAEEQSLLGGVMLFRAHCEVQRALGTLGDVLATDGLLAGRQAYGALQQAMENLGDVLATLEDAAKAR